MALEERLQRLVDAGRAEEPTTVELSLKQWVEHNGRLVLGGSNDTECFKTVVVNDEQELEMQVRRTVLAEFCDAWVDVALFRKHVPRLDIGQVIANMDGGLLRAGQWSARLHKQLEMPTPCGVKLKDWPEQRRRPPF